MKRTSPNEVYCNAVWEGTSAYRAGHTRRHNPYPRPSREAIRVFSSRLVHHRSAGLLTSDDLSHLGWRDGWRRAYDHDRWERRWKRRLGDYAAWPPRSGP